MAFFSTQIKDLQNQVLALTTERDEHAANVTALSEANAQFTERHDTDTAAILALTGERDAALAQVSTLVTERDTSVQALATANADTEERIQAEVVNRCNAAGVDPIKRDPAAVDSTTAANADATSGLTGMDKARAALKARHQANFSANSAN